MGEDLLKIAIEASRKEQPGAKAKRYIGNFFDRIRIDNKIIAKVEGNHGIYTVSIDIKDNLTDSACSCYIGGNGYCHHCEALAFTFLNNPDSFMVSKHKTLKEVRNLNQVQAYLKGKSLDSLLHELKAQGITNKEFAESIEMNPRNLSSIRSSELRNRYYNELGAVKLACLWVFEHIKKPKK